MSVEAGNKVTKLSLGGQAIAKLLGGKHVKYDGGSLHDDHIEMYGHSTEVRCACPECHCESHSYHSSYIRTLRSLPISGKPVIIHLAVRKYRCMNPSCPRRVFSGQVPGLTESHSRKTVYVKEYLERLLVEVSSVKGAYIAGLSGIPCSASSCLRVLDRLPTVPEVAPSARRLCIDDFAYRKGQNYGSIIIDADTHRVLEIFEGRNKETAVAALKKYQGVEAVGREGAGTGLAGGGTGSGQVPPREKLRGTYAGAAQGDVRHRLGRTGGELLRKESAPSGPSAVRREGV